MNEQEAKLQSDRVEKFRKLDAVKTQIREAITKITEDCPTGPNGSGPFTGNTRESRRIQSMHLKFTATRGGAHAVELEIPELYIEANELWRAVEAMLRAKLKLVIEEIEKL